MAESYQMRARHSRASGTFPTEFGRSACGAPGAHSAEGSPPVSGIAQRWRDRLTRDATVSHEYRRQCRLAATPWNMA
jgi:hypothetical protein